MRQIDYIYQNFDPISFSKNIKNYKKYLSGGDKYFLTKIVLDSFRDINEIKNKINLNEFTKIDKNKIYLNFIKDHKNYTNKDIEKYFINKHNIVNDYASYKYNDNYEDLEFLVQEHVNCGEIFRNYPKFFEIIFYAQVTFKEHTDNDDLHFGMYSDFYCLNVKKSNKYFLFQFDYEQDGNDYAHLTKVFSKKPNKIKLIKILKSEIYYHDFINKDEIIVNEVKKFDYDKSYNRIFSKGYRIQHKIDPHFTNEEEYFNFHNTKGNYSIARNFATTNPKKYFKKYFQDWRWEELSFFLSSTSGKIKEKVSKNKFFNFVMSDKLNFRSNIKFIEKIIYSYDDLDGFLNYIPKKIQESKALKEEIRILRLFRGKNKKFIIEVFRKNEDKLEDLVKNYMPSTIFDDPLLMDELIKLDINNTAYIGPRLKKNKKFMSKVKKILEIK